MMKSNVVQKGVEKVEEKEEEKKILEETEGDFSYNCNYCNGHNHCEKDCMLRRQEEMKESEG